MTKTGIFATICPECGGALEPTPQLDDASTALHACGNCDHKYRVHLGYAIPVAPPLNSPAA